MPQLFADSNFFFCRVGFLSGTESLSRRGSYLGDKTAPAQLSCISYPFTITVIFSSWARSATIAAINFFRL